MTTSKQKTSKKAQSSRKLVSADKVQASVNNLIDPAILNTLPPHYRSRADQSIKLLGFCSEDQGMTYESVFTPLLGAIDKSAKDYIMRLLQPELPTTKDGKKDWFEPNMDGVNRKLQRKYRDLAKSLKRTLMSNNGLSPIGLLRSCLDYSLNCTTKIDGVFTALRNQFWIQSGHKLLEIIDRINKFRNTYIAHQEKELTDRNMARQELNVWIEALQQLSC